MYAMYKIWLQSAVIINRTLNTRCKPHLTIVRTENTRHNMRENKQVLNSQKAILWTNNGVAEVSFYAVYKQIIDSFSSRIT